MPCFSTNPTLEAPESGIAGMAGIPVGGMPAGMAGIPVGGMSAGMAGMAQHGMAISWPRGQGHPDPALNYQHVKMCSSYLRFLVTMFGPPNSVDFLFSSGFLDRTTGKAG